MLNHLAFNVFAILCTLAIFYLVYQVINLQKNTLIYENKKNIIVITALVIAALYCYYLYHLTVEKFIRFWDYTAYWQIAIDSGENMNNNIFGGIKNILSSIYYSDHNDVPSLFIQSLFRPLGQSKWAYIFSIFVVYLVPVIILFTVLFSKVVKAASKQDFNVKLFAAMTVVAFSPGLNHPLLLGYIDIIGVVFILGIMVIVKDYDFSEFNFKKMFFLGVLFVLLFVCRRWYVYWIIGFFVAIGISTFITEFFINKDYKMFMKKIKNIFIFGFSLLVFVLLFFYPVIERVIKLDLAVAFSGYKNGGFLYEIKDLLTSLGIIPVIIMFIGIFISFYKKESRSFLIMLAIIPLIAIAIFVQIQNMCLHHRYLVLPSFLYFQGVGVIGIIDLIKNTISQKVAGTVFVAIYAFNFIFSANSIKTSGLFTNSMIEPVKMESYDENVQIAKYIENVYKKTGNKTYILASSEIFNDGIIEGYYLPNMKMSQMLYHVNHIDLRDGFPLQFLEDKSLVVVTPVQYHMRPEDQRVIGILTNAVLNVPEVSKHYQVFKKWKTDQDQTIYFLNRISDLDEEAIEYFKNEFNKYYSDYPELFEERLS